MIGDLAYQPLKGNVEDLQAQSAAKSVRIIALLNWASPPPKARSAGESEREGRRERNIRLHPRCRRKYRVDLRQLSRCRSLTANQGEIARTKYALTQAQEQEKSASDTVLSDVATPTKR